jgi:hypothetical protein
VRASKRASESASCLGHRAELLPGGALGAVCVALGWRCTKPIACRRKHYCVHLVSLSIEASVQVD